MKRQTLTTTIAVLLAALVPTMSFAVGANPNKTAQEWRELEKQETAKAEREEAKAPEANERFNGKGVEKGLEAEQKAAADNVAKETKCSR